MTQRNVLNTFYWFQRETSWLKAHSHRPTSRWSKLQKLPHQGDVCSHCQRQLTRVNFLWSGSIYCRFKSCGTVRTDIAGQYPQTKKVKRIHKFVSFSGRSFTKQTNEETIPKIISTMIIMTFLFLSWFVCWSGVIVHAKMNHRKLMIMFTTINKWLIVVYSFRNDNPIDPILCMHFLHT